MDYLKKACREQGFDLIYTNNSYLILSSEVINYAPTLHAYNKLSECPEEVAESIVKYYAAKDAQHLMTIESYLDDSLFFLGYVIAPPDDEFLSVSKSYHTSHIKQRDLPKEEDELPCSKELDVLSITCVDSDGNVYRIKPGGIIQSPSEDIKEVNIVVEDE